MAAAKHARCLGLQPDEIFDLDCIDLVRKPSATGPLLWRQLVIESSGQNDSDQRLLKLFADARIIVTRNINTPRGIVNGVFGTDANNDIDAIIVRPDKDLGRMPKLPGIPTEEELADDSTGPSGLALHNKETVNFTNRPTADKVSIIDHYIHRDDDLLMVETQDGNGNVVKSKRDLSLYELVQQFRFEAIPKDEQGRDRPRDGVRPGAVSPTKRGRHKEDRYYFRDTHPQTKTLRIAKRPKRDVPVPLFNKKLSQPADIGAAESRALIALILFELFHDTA
ncbi:hypothetical protein H9P43_003861 [Blastocladiella emersonii ATCC 22665]|nr:hypothetical protein H9P43_003861 [Blastocladiella emersonii ATCC 22665]